jgi:1,2-diacylglycerol 3-beta-galactosyltransferase
MKKKKRILILTADTGFGHRSAANAISETLKDKYGNLVKVEIVNPLDDPSTSTFLHDTQSDYDKWVREVPELYQLGYQVSDNPIPNFFVEQYFSAVLNKSMTNIFQRCKPDVVVSTYPAYQLPVDNLFVARSRPVPFYTVVTDLATVHRLWFHHKVTGCLVPNQLVADLALDAGLPEEKIQITGIPVAPAIAKEKRSKNVIRQELGWNQDIPTVLVVGSKRVEGLIEALEVLNHFGGELQVVAIAGKDEEMYREIKQLDWHIPSYIYDFVENMPALMKASDLIICKAGGLIVTESLACSLPMILIDVIPGQETGNAEYAISHGAADQAGTPFEILKNITHLLRNDRSLLKERTINAHNLGLPDSAYAVADILWRATELKEPVSVPHSFQSAPVLSGK